MGICGIDLPRLNGKGLEDGERRGELGGIRGGRMGRGGRDGKVQWDRAAVLLSFEAMGSDWIRLMDLIGSVRWI